MCVTAAVTAALTFAVAVAVAIPVKSVTLTTLLLLLLLLPFAIITFVIIYHTPTKSMVFVLRTTCTIPLYQKLFLKLFRFK